GERVADAMRAQEALRAEMLERTQAEERFRQLLEATPDAIMIVDGQGTVALVNASTERLFHRPRVRLVGPPVAELVPRAFEWARASVASGEAVSSESIGPGAVTPAEPALFALRAGSAAVPVEIRVNPLVIEGRTLLAIAIRDVTERQRAAHALRTLNTELEGR